jgi:hypothetical protein
MRAVVFSTSFSASVPGLRSPPANPFLAELPPPRIARRQFRAGDNATIPSPSASAGR